MAFTGPADGDDSSFPPSPNANASSPSSRLQSYAANVEVPTLNFLESLLLLYPPRAYESQITRQICDNIDLGMDLVGRPLNQGETDAFVAQAEGLVKTPRRGAVVGLLAGGAFTIFPIHNELRDVLSQQWRRRRRSSPSASASASSSSSLSSSAAMQFFANKFPWWKLGVTTGIGIFTGAILGNIVSAAVASQRLMTDARLTRFREDRRSQDPEVVLQRIRDRAMSRAGAVPQAFRGPPSQGVVRPDPALRQGITAPAAGEYADTAGLEDRSWDGESNGNGNGDGEGINPSDSQIVRDLYSKHQNQWNEQQTAAATTQSSSFYETPNKAGSGGDVLNDLMDDYSSDPDSPSYNPAARPAPAQYRPGSAWARLRQEAAHGSGVGGGGGGGSGDADVAVGSSTIAVADSFSTSSQRQRQQQQQRAGQGAVSDETLQREQAQREFDDMLERERHRED